MTLLVNNGLKSEKKGGSQRRRPSLTFALRYTAFPITAS